MTIPDELARFLPASTLRTWEKVVPAVPEGAYLAGGTAITAHLRHRVSRDLDFFSAVPFDPADVEARLHRLGTFARTCVDDGTLNGVFEQTKVQFLDASSQRVVAGLVEIGGLQVAALADLLAMKLKVIADRGEMRDYFDIWSIERDAGLRIEEGLGVFLARYRSATDQQVLAIVRALGSFEDVADDPTLPADRRDIEQWFTRRQPEVAANLDRSGTAGFDSAADGLLVELALRRPVGAPDRCGAWMPRARAVCNRPRGHRPPHRR